MTSILKVNEHAVQLAAPLILRVVAWSTLVVGWVYLFYGIAVIGEAAVRVPLFGLTAAMVLAMIGTWGYERKLPAAVFLIVSMVVSTICIVKVLLLMP
tara:strand:+ start:323 stop:616 length:294 start_codon:yes stop_codon:yes gene_type:complete